MSKPEFTPTHFSDASKKIQWMLDTVRQDLNRLHAAGTKAVLAVTLKNCDDKISGLKTENLSGFFLNLDTRNKVAFLNVLSGGGLQLDMPYISNWKMRGTAIFRKTDGSEEPAEHFTQDQVRDCFSFFSDLSEWNVYPLDLVWIWRFIRYAHNNSTPDGQYGNFPNWAKYFSKLSELQKIEFISTKLTD